MQVRMLVLKSSGALSVICLLVNLIGCASTQDAPLPWRTQKIVEQAKQKGFRMHPIPTSHFLLTSLEKTRAPANLIHLYIEGDGSSWKSKYQLSENPTPKQPLALQLALLDPYPQVIYLARPCQYTPLKEEPNCQAKYWSSHRYAPEVIAAMNQALNQIQVQHPDAQWVLIGFSGGASIAVQLAAMRQDVKALITVAGDLDHGMLNRYHGTTPLYGSINPITLTHKLRKIPQYHWSGANDLIVPPFIAANFVKAINTPELAHHHVLPKATHHKLWQAHWREILAKAHL